jgi:hypothetical protein
MSYFIVNDHPGEELIVHGPFPTRETAERSIDYWTYTLHLRVAKLENHEVWFDGDDIILSEALRTYLAAADLLEISSIPFHRERLVAGADRDLYTDTVVTPIIKRTPEDTSGPTAPS